ncbi:MAG: hypothetical protein R3F14_27830 [Polyangiaceae bacterium]
MWTLSRDGLIEYRLSDPDTDSPGEGEPCLPSCPRRRRATSSSSLPEQSLVSSALSAFAWDRLHREGEPVSSTPGSGTDAVARALFEGRVLLLACPASGGGGSHREEAPAEHDQEAPLRPTEEAGSPETFHRVAVKLVDCEHVPLPPQGTLLTLPDGTRWAPCRRRRHRPLRARAGGGVHLDRRRRLPCSDPLPHRPGAGS